jgi:hypothetical protein
MTAAPRQLKLGRRAPSGKPTLKASRFLTSVVPDHPAQVDHLAGGTWEMGKNDVYGTCGPVSLANYVRMVSRSLSGAQRNPTWADIRALYVRQNPTFDERTGAGDDGVDMVTMLSDAVKYGYGSEKIIGFAAVDANDIEECRAASAIFGGILLGLDLDQAQEQQLNQHTGVWDYVDGSPDWGGHAVMEGAYEASPDGEDIVTWAERVRMTRAFCQRQRIEAYVVLLPDHLSNPRFVAGWDMAKYASAWEQMTGRSFPATVPPAPQPAPQPRPLYVDDALASAVRPWVESTHTWETKKAKTAADALRTWMKATGRA